jgi:formylglycine-generating enzyme required for sulfatase activity
VTYEQAVNYCKWRTEIVKSFADKINPRSSYGSSYKAKKFYYRLPTKEEWEYAAHAGIWQAYGFEGIHVKNNLLNYNVKEAGLLSYGADITVPVNSGVSNKYNLYNMIGNVAEMISEKGVSKGGSWRHGLDECKITDSVKYEKPEAWLGFRCVCVVQ